MRIELVDSTVYSIGVERPNGGGVFAPLNTLPDQVRPSRHRDGGVPAATLRFAPWKNGRCGAGAFGDAGGGYPDVHGHIVSVTR